MLGAALEKLRLVAFDVLDDALHAFVWVDSHVDKICNIVANSGSVDIKREAHLPRNTDNFSGTLHDPQILPSARLGFGIKADAIYDHRDGAELVAAPHLRHHRATTDALARGSPPHASQDEKARRKDAPVMRGHPGKAP